MSERTAPPSLMRQLSAIAALPFMVTVVMPSLIVHRRGDAPDLGLWCMLGAVIMAGGLARAVGAWAMLFFVINALYFRFVEGPRLLRRSGSDHADYKARTPAWWPRFNG